MNRYISYDDSGEIIAIIHSEDLPDGVDSPFVPQEGRYSLLVPEGKYKEMPLLELHEGYMVDVKAKKLVKRKISDGK